PRAGGGRLARARDRLQRFRGAPSRTGARDPGRGDLRGDGARAGLRAPGTARRGRGDRAPVPALRRSRTRALPPGSSRVHASARYGSGPRAAGARRRERDRGGTPRMSDKVLITSSDPGGLARAVEAATGQPLPWIRLDAPGFAQATVWFCA